MCLFIYLSGVTDPNIMIKAVKTSPETFIRKPYEIDELNIAIEKALEKEKLKITLLKSEKFYRNIIENSSDAIYTINEKDEVTSFNAIAEKIFGISKNEIIKKKYSQLYKNVPKKHLNLIHHLDINSIIEIPLVINNINGWIEVSMSAISNEDGSLIKTHFIRDITTKKER